MTPWGLLGAATAVACTSTVVGFLGRLWWPFEVTSHFRPQYSLFLLASTLLFLIARKQRAAILAGVFAFTNLSLFVPLYVGVSWSHAGEKTYRALVMNVNASSQAYERVQKFIRSAEPDFMVLLEVSRTWGNELQKLQ